ncbi:hypothetical protein AHAS_Ahas06G0168900 [Arachis hypogaea]
MNPLNLSLSSSSPFFFSEPPNNHRATAPSSSFSSAFPPSLPSSVATSSSQRRSSLQPHQSYCDPWLTSSSRLFSPPLNPETSTAALTLFSSLAVSVSTTAAAFTSSAGHCRCNITGLLFL